MANKQTSFKAKSVEGERLVRKYE